jgi:splicing factor 3B subunit 2
MTVESFLDGASVDADPSAYSEFQGVFKHFQEGAGDGLAADAGAVKGHVYYSDDEDEDEEAQQRAIDDGLSRRQRREAAKLSIAELKQLVDRPEVVEYFDRDARDPRLLVSLKSYRNTVPVPTHWNAKRDYLAGRRGMEKTPYRLPRES